jgi:hypothetical protein
MKPKKIGSAEHFCPDLSPAKRYLPIFQYDEGFIRIITDGNESKLKNIQSLSTSDSYNKIVAAKVVQKELTSSHPSASQTDECEGKAGKQRVKGRVVISYSYTVDIYGTGEILTKPRGYAYAVNQKKNIWGNWSKKRTRQLRIEGTNVDYDICQFSGDGLTIYKDTGGDLKKEITEDIFLFTQYFPGPTTCSPESITGNFKFYGRNGTNCPLNLI